jgi:hypothetical protein
MPREVSEFSPDLAYSTQCRQQAAAVVTVRTGGELCGPAQAALRDGGWDQVAARVSEALALWWGEPLADVDCEMLARREAPWLAELRLQALEARIEAQLHLGDHAAVIAELRHLTAAQPLRDHPHLRPSRATPSRSSWSRRSGGDARASPGPNADHPP